MGAVHDVTSLSPLVPVDADGIARALLPFGRSTMLPSAAYTSPDVLAWERRNFFAGSWTCIGRLDDLRTEGTTQRALRVGDIPVLLTFEDDVVRAFANTCRHRGHVLLGDDETSTTKSVTCLYHAWTYRLDGTLRSAPGLRPGGTLDYDDHGLVPLPVERWRGWLFVNATGDAASFADHLGAIDDAVAPYRPESLTLRARHTYEVGANWKLVAENYHECYHCPLIHPELCQVSVPTGGENIGPTGAYFGGTLDLRPDAETMSLDGRSQGTLIDGAPTRTILYLHLFPNLLVSLHPDYVMTHRLLPLDVDRTWIECSWYFPDPEVDPSYAVSFWDLTNSQDWRACELVQRGLTSPHFRPGPFAPGEEVVHELVHAVARGYLGIPPHVRD